MFLEYSILVFSFEYYELFGDMDVFALVNGFVLA
jgi:hypothetical protein